MLLSRTFSKDRGVAAQVLDYRLTSMHLHQVRRDNRGRPRQLLLLLLLLAIASAGRQLLLLLLLRLLLLLLGDAPRQGALQG